MTVVDDLSSGDRARVPAGAELHELDVVDLDGLRALAREVQPQAIYHLAAQASVVASVEDPLRDCDVNVKGTLNVLEVARENEAPVVFTSTGGALYGDEAPRPTGEDRIPAPLSPYGSSKWAAEAYVKTWYAVARHPQRHDAAGQRLRPPPEPPRGGGGGGDLHPPPVHRQGPEALRTREADAGLCIRGRRGRRPAAGRGKGGHLQRGHRRGNRRGHDLEGALPGGRQVDRAPARGPEAGGAPAQLPGREPRRTGARVDGEDVDLRGPRRSPTGP